MVLAVQNLNEMSGNLGDPRYEKTVVPVLVIQEPHGESGPSPVSLNFVRIVWTVRTVIR